MTNWFLCWRVRASNVIYNKISMFDCSVRLVLNVEIQFKSYFANDDTRTRWHQNRLRNDGTVFSKSKNGLFRVVALAFCIINEIIVFRTVSYNKSEIISFDHTKMKWFVFFRSEGFFVYVLKMNIVFCVKHPQPRSNRTIVRCNAYADTIKLCTFPI